MPNDIITLWTAFLLSLFSLAVHSHRLFLSRTQRRFASPECLHNLWSHLLLRVVDFFNRLLLLVTSNAPFNWAILKRDGKEGPPFCHLKWADASSWAKGLFGQPGVAVASHLPADVITPLDPHSHAGSHPDSFFSWAPAPTLQRSAAALALFSISVHGSTSSTSRPITAERVERSCEGSLWWDCTCFPTCVISVLFFSSYG